MQSAPALSLVDGALDPQRDVAGTAGHLTLTLPSALTAALLTRVPAAFHGGINDVLLTGLALGVADWCRRHEPWRGSSHSRHGSCQRELMRCCWIWRVTAARRCSRISICRARSAGTPACSRCGLSLARWISRRRLPAATRSGAPSRASRNSCARCRTTGLAMVCCVTSTARRRRSLRGHAAPQIGFNYLGRVASPGAADWAFAEETVRLGGGDPQMPLGHCIEINAHTLDAADGSKLIADLVVRAGADRARMRFAIWRRAGSGPWKRWCVMPRSPAPEGARRPICRWLRSRRPRSSGWRASIRGSRTCCRCRRCRRVCCSMRFMMRRRRTSIRSSWSLIWRARSTARRWKRRRKL